ncbi:hypothetical protein A5N74_19645 [Prescottella equi]|nr:hypothetical protein A5N69_15325 [Prescottella equi]ORM16021.1 hypothetical protein A5N74_19645 [Prescottella equi]
MSNQPLCAREGCEGQLGKLHFRRGFAYCSSMCESVDEALDQLRDSAIARQGMSKRLDQAYTEAWVSLVEVADALSRHRQANEELWRVQRAHRRFRYRQKLRAQKAALRAAQNEPSVAS